MNIAYFFDNRETAKSYAVDLFNLMSKYDDGGNVKLKQKDLTIESFGNKIRFIVIKDFKDVAKIQGHVYDGVFIKSVFTTEIDRYILSRFRPRCACKATQDTDKLIELRLEEE